MGAKKTPEPVLEGRSLSGMKEICAYARRSESTVLDWIRNLDFPAKKLGGQWESNAALIDAWKVRQIQGDAAFQFSGNSGQPG